MAIVNTSINAPTDGTYGLPNLIIGQLKTILLNDPNVSIVSDNDPTNTTQRILVYSIASQNHYMKFATTSGTQISISLLKNDGSTAFGTQTWALSSSYSYDIKFLYNSKAHMLVITRSGTVHLLFWALNIGDTSNGWYFRSPTSGSVQTCYVHANDNAAFFATPAYSVLDDTGKLIGIRIRFGTSGNINQYYHPYAYGANVTTAPIGFYSDGTYVYLSTGYEMIADRVPS